MNFVLKKIYKRWPLCCLLFFIVACNTKSHSDSFIPSKKDSIAEAQRINAALDSVYLKKKLVMSGDLILRTGNDFASETFRKLSLQDKTYSHCGIASIENDSVFVYHAIGGEWNPNQKLRKDPFEIFCNPFENRGFGIFRYNLNSTEKVKLINLVQSLFSQGIEFDMQFDLSSNDKMYCSEFVYKAVEQATENKIKLSTTTYKQIQFIAVDNLFINPECREIQRTLFAK
jgi:hypothetical protein